MTRLSATTGISNRGAQLATLNRRQRLPKAVFDFTMKADIGAIGRTRPHCRLCCRSNAATRVRPVPNVAFVGKVRPLATGRRLRKRTLAEFAERPTSMNRGGFP